MKIIALIIIALQLAGLVYVMFSKKRELSDEEIKKNTEQYDKELRAMGSSISNEILTDWGTRAKWNNYGFSTKLFYFVITLVLLGIVSALVW
jgi:hypothetical protein